MAVSDRLVWIDLEMTGLDTQHDEIVEIACIVTDPDLTELDEGISLVVKPNDAPLAAMDPVVVKMHNDSGLIHEIPNGIELADAEASFADLEHGSLLQVNAGLKAKGLAPITTAPGGAEAPPTSGAKPPAQLRSAWSNLRALTSF